MDELIQLAKECTLETGSHPPTVFVEGTESKGAMRLSGAEIPEEREREMFQAGALISRVKSVGKLKQICLVSEGWIAPFNEGNFIRPSEDPERIEALLFNCLDVAINKQTLDVFRMVRNPEGNLPIFG